MFIPFVTTPDTSRSARRLYRRKGGGGGGKGGGGSSGSGSKGGGSTGGGGGGTSSTSPKSIPITGKTPTGRGSASTYGSGGGKTTTIPSGSAFAGRTVGGGTRSQVFGNSCVFQLFGRRRELTFRLSLGHMEAAILALPLGAYQDVASLSSSGQSFGAVLLEEQLEHIFTKLTRYRSHLISLQFGPLLT